MIISDELMHLIYTTMLKLPMEVAEPIVIRIRAEAMDEKARMETANAAASVGSLPQ